MRVLYRPDFLKNPKDRTIKSRLLAMRTNAFFFRHFGGSSRFLSSGGYSSILLADLGQNQEGGSHPRRNVGIDPLDPYIWVMTEEFHKNDFSPPKKNFEKSAKKKFSKKISPRRKILDQKSPNSFGRRKR